MSYLAIEQLQNNVTVTQQIRLNKSTNLESIRLNMYKQGILIDGIVSIEVYSGINLLGIMALSYADINTVGTNYYGMIRFIPTAGISIRKLPSAPYLTLDLKITLSSHTNSELIFIGLIKEPSLQNNQYNLTNNPNSPANSEMDIWYHPFSLEIYTT